MTRRWLASNANLRLRFVLPISVIVVVCIAIISGYLINRQADGFRRELRATGETIIKILAVNAESGVLFESIYELDALLEGTQRFASVDYCLIRNLDGIVLSHLGQNHLAREQLTALREDAQHQMTLVSDYYEDEHGHKLLVLIAPITHEKQVVHRESLGLTGSLDQTMTASTVAETIGWIELGMSMDSMDKATTEAARAVILLAALVLLLTIIVVTVIVSKVVKPITLLAEATDQISRGDFSTIVTVDRSDEIGRLAETFNRMTSFLKQSREEIEQYNRTLEEKIIERTQQLEEAQAQLIQSEKMSAIGQLAAGVAHELNNPLGGILGYAQFTLEKLRKNTPERTTPKEIESYVRYVGDIELQARRCKTIVQNLLRFSRSSRTVEFEEVNINQTLEQTLSFVEHQLRISQMELKVEMASDIPVIQGNAGQLQQVFTNLIINAMHASKPGSTITVSTRYCPALGQFGGTVEVAIIDHGHGIDRENLKKIFEPFFTTKEVGKGTGLGLSVSYGIVKEHGGEITVESETGRGTTFTVIIPVQKPEPSADIAEKAESEQKA
ncbi:MAG: ATP-binding protein [Candidatus Zixiibacteriota bacterium]